MRVAHANPGANLYEMTVFVPRMKDDAENSLSTVSAVVQKMYGNMVTVVNRNI